MRIGEEEFDENLLVTMPIARSAGLCARGARAFAIRHNLDWRKFLSGGIPSGELLATGDQMALAVVRKAHGR